MNVKEARGILNTPGFGVSTSESREASGFLEATKAAEPLLVIIIKLYHALNQFLEPYVEQRCEHGRIVKSADLYLAKEALSSSAQVVEKYKRETLGE